MAENTEFLRTGTVVESLPNIMFRVRLDPPSGGAGQAGEEVLSFLSGKMRLHRIRVLVGDRVELALDPYGGKARISKRL